MTVVKDTILTVHLVNDIEQGERRGNLIPKELGTWSGTRGTGDHFRKEPNFFCICC